MSRTNYIFVDFENVQETDLRRIANKPVKIIFMLGAQNKSLPVKFAKQLLHHAGQVALVETSRTGNNALDLILSEQIGEAKHADPRGYFHIISRDKDYDALIGHLNDTGAKAARHEAFSKVPILMDATERANFLAEAASNHEASRPKKRVALATYIQKRFGSVLSPAEVEETIEGMVKKGFIAISAAGEVQYP